MALIALSSKTPAAAEPTALECAEANGAMKALADAGKWRAARDKGTTCSSSKCPKTVLDECSGRLATLNKAIPTLLFVVTDSSGNEHAAVRVTMDGQPLVDRLDGRAVAVDLGQHALVFQADGFAPVTKTIVAREAEKDRRVEVKLERTAPAPAPQPTAPPAPAPPPAPTPPPPPTTSTPVQTSATSPPPATGAEPAGSSPSIFQSRWPAYAAFAVGAAGLVVGTIYGFLAIDSKHKLDGSCTSDGACPASDQSAIDSLHTQETVSTVGFAVGFVGAATGAALYWVSHRTPQRSAQKGLHPWFAVGIAGVAGELP